MEISSVTQNVLDYLRSKIITGELQPGQKLNETALSNQFGISRPPLREAFRLLEQHHLVKSIPRRGCFVAEISLEDCTDIYKIRQMIELFAIDLIKEKRKREFPGLEDAIAAEQNVKSIPNPTTEQKLEHMQLFVLFHQKLVESSENSWAIWFYETILYNLARYQFKLIHLPGLTDNSYGEHQQILKFLQSGKYKKAQMMLREHLEVSAGIVQNNLPKTYSGKYLSSEKHRLT